MIFITNIVLYITLMKDRSVLFELKDCLVCVKVGEKLHSEFDKKNPLCPSFEVLQTKSIQMDDGRTDRNSSNETSS